MSGLLFSTTASILTGFPVAFTLSGMFILAGRSHFGQSPMEDRTEGALQSAPNQPPMPRALIDTSARNRHLTESAPKSIILTIALLFEEHLGSRCFIRIHIAPSSFASIGSEDIWISFCPISHRVVTGFRWGAEIIYAKAMVHRLL
nr:hypothetical protein Iba_chr04fCG6850 [Ipomoea batatas]